MQIEQNHLKMRISWISLLDAWKIITPQWLVDILPLQGITGDFQVGLEAMAQIG